MRRGIALKVNDFWDNPSFVILILRHAQKRTLAKVKSSLINF